MLLTIKDVMARYQVSENTVRAWMSQNKLQPINIGAGSVPRWRFTQESLLEFEQRSQAAAPVKQYF